jgi:hypothetical protein
MATREDQTAIRTASVATFDDQPVGVCIVLSPVDLRALGVDPDTTTTVRYWADTQDHQLRLRSTEQEG